MTCARISKWRPVLPGIHWRSHRGQFPVRHRRSLQRAPRRHTAHTVSAHHTRRQRARLTPVDATLYVILRAATPRSRPQPVRRVPQLFYPRARRTVRPTKIPDRTVHFYFQNGWVPPPLPPSVRFELTPVPDAESATCLAARYRHLLPSDCDRAAQRRERREDFNLATCFDNDSLDFDRVVKS